MHEELEKKFHSRANLDKLRPEVNRRIARFNYEMRRFFAASALPSLFLLVMTFRSRSSLFHNEESIFGGNLYALHDKSSH